MKLFIKLIIFLVLFAFVGPYLLMGPDGMTKFRDITSMVIDKMDFSMPSTEDLTPDIDLNSTSAAPMIEWAKEKLETPKQLTKEQLAALTIEAKEHIFYRWQDKNGVWQFSNLPNRNTLNYVVRTDPDANLLQGMTEEQIDIALGRYVPDMSTSNSITENNPFANGEGLENEMPIPTTVPMAQIPQLIDQAKDVQRIMDERVKNMDKMLNRDL
ncbi:MAG: hypothetical protein MI808_24680 [Pseudomonadales bacterium]|nr:hypothetical protein [Pseudomonadales bacterium]